ncbi:MAG: hypothetical protein AAF901_10445 [Bacteroidota bacterium]
MRSLKAIVVTFMLLPFASVAQENSWVTVKDTDKGYRVDFPQEAKKGSQDVPTAKGVVVMHTYTITSTSLDAKNLLYMSSFSEYPSDFFPNGLDSEDAQNDVLDGAVEGAVTNVKGKLIMNESITFNGYPGRHIKIEVDQDALYVLTMRNILVDFKMYILQTISLKGSSDNREAKKFFDSFELINVKK